MGIGTARLTVRTAAMRTAAVAASLACFTAALHAHAQNQAQNHAQDRNPATIVLDSHAQILVDAAQPEPVRRAARDLAADMQAVFGSAPAVVTEARQPGGVLVVLGDELQPASVAPADHDAAEEAFSITGGSASLGGPRPTSVIRLAGSGVRGTLFAIYQFSQQYLGVDPMYYFTDHAPAKRASLSLPAALHQRYAAPVFRYRGFFLNDEDLLTGWAPGEAQDHTGISLAVWDRIFETILRLKGNMVVAGTWPFPDDPQDRLVAARGLLLNQHHATPLGVNFSRWPRDVPYNLTSSPQYIENAWKNAVAAYPANQQILWELGLRGLSDQPYAELDPSVRGDQKAEGRVISKAIAEQIGIVQARYPQAVFITDLWMEGAKLRRSGDLVIPPNVITVWPDTGYGDMQDEGQVRKGDGAYMHVAMYNERANQLSELTPVERIFSSLGRFQTAGATSFLLVNTSDLRPVTMGASAVLDFGWQGSAIGSASDFYKSWSQEEFGPGAAEAVAGVYRAYFAAPARESPARPYGDNYYHTVARDLLRTAMLQWPTYQLPNQAPFWKQPGLTNQPYDPAHAVKVATREAAACGAAKPRWDAVWQQAEAAQALVAPDRREFYQAGVLTMIQINRQSNEALLALSQAVLAFSAGNHAAALDHTHQALAALDTLKDAEHRAEYGKWQGWYRGDWLTGVDGTRRLAEDFASYLQHPDTSAVPPIEWAAWEAYYHIQHYEGTRTVDVR